MAGISVLAMPVTANSC